MPSVDIKKRIMKKEYIKPEIVTEILMLDSMLASSNLSEEMGSDKIPGGDDAFNANGRRGGGWGNLWNWAHNHM